MKKILFFMVLMVSFLFSAVNLQTASKDELMCLKGIGEKKAMAIIKYRKSNKLKSADDLIEIKGFGKGIIASVKKGTKTVKCGGKKTSPKKSTTKKSTTKKSTTKKDSSKKTDKVKKDTSKKSDKSKDTDTKKETPKKTEKSKKEDKSEKLTKESKSEDK
jgi:competence protein ComEA